MSSLVVLASIEAQDLYHSHIMLDNITIGIYLHKLHEAQLLFFQCLRTFFTSGLRALGSTVHIYI